MTILNIFMHACCALPANEAIIFAVNRNKAVNSVSSAENKRQNYKFSTRLPETFNFVSKENTRTQCSQLLATQGLFLR